MTQEGPRSSPRLAIVPVTFDVACGFVEMWHRHHQPPAGHEFSLGVTTPDGVLRGVAMVGRSVARNFDNGQTLEVTRAATDGTANANSALYAAAWRATKALGWTKLITYTQSGESGSSLRGAGWCVLAERRPNPGWDRPSRPRELQGTERIARTLWEAS